MKMSETSWKRWLSLAALSILLGGYLLINFPLKPWISGLAGILIAGIAVMVFEFLLPFFTRMKEHRKEIDPSVQFNRIGSLSQIIVTALRKLLQSHTEKEVLEVALESGTDLIGANGASFVPFDEWGKSLPVLTYGKVPGSIIHSWAQRLSTPDTRQTCKNCQSLIGDSECILLSSSKKTFSKVRCFSLSSSTRELGVLNYYYENDTEPNSDAVAFLKELIDSAGEALEKMHSRDKEISALLYLQTVNSPKSDISVLFSNLLENVQQALDVDFVILYLPGGIPGQIGSNPQFFSCSKDGSSNVNGNLDLPLLEGIWKNVLRSGESVSLENVVFNKLEKWKSLLAVPLAWRGEDPLGVLILGSTVAQAFIQRHQALLETLAGQAALLLQNAQLMVQVEYQAVVDERTRLAREIHDGLAQTLAFLKIQAAQMQSLMARGEMEKLASTLQANYRTLSDAYIDARQAIDDLRKVPTTNFGDWIRQVALDFEQTTQQKVDVYIGEYSVEYPANIQAQLIRIVQEALNNVRKHAEATFVKITGRTDGQYYIIEISDNGKGFDPDSGNAEGISRYGLRGMRERSENIGADFQIISQMGRGTCVSLRVPLLVKEEI